ncbi:hypothetical protein AAHB62_26360 [Bacillus cereus]
MKTVYRSKRYSFIIPSKTKENKYIRGNTKTEIGMKIYDWSKKVMNAFIQLEEL